MARESASETLVGRSVNCALQIAAKKYVFNFSEDFDHRADAIWNSANLPKETVSQDMQISGTLGKFRMTATKTDFNLSFIP